jgi:F-type H+-transporting ATPase subunit a
VPQDGKPLQKFQIAQAETEAPKTGAEHTGAAGETHAETGVAEHEEFKLGDIPSPWLLFNNAVCVAILMVALGSAMRRKMSAIPQGIGNFGEFIVESMMNFTSGIIGPGGEKYTPLVGTIFFFILVSNLWGQIPGLHAPTANLSTTLALGLIVFVYVQFIGIKSTGLGGYLKHFMGPMPAIAPLLFPIEVISELVKPFTLAMRLFGNIFGEDTVIVVLATLAVTMIPKPVGGLIPFQLPIAILGLLTSFVQAMVFSLLTCIYISLQSHHDSEHEGHGHDHHGHGHPGIEESGLVP